MYQMIPGIIVFILAFVEIRSYATREIRSVVIDAIFEYRRDVMREHGDEKFYESPFEVGYGDMGSYLKTFFQIWVWSPRQVLSREKYQVVRDYIEKHDHGL